MALDPLQYFTTDQHCPACRKYGHWRAGQEFDHMKRCPDCEIVWVPENVYNFQMFNKKYELSLTPESVARPPMRKPAFVRPKPTAPTAAPTQTVDERTESEPNCGIVPVPVPVPVPEALAVAIESGEGSIDGKPSDDEDNLPVIKLHFERKPIPLPKPMFPPKPTRPRNLYLTEGYESRAPVDPEERPKLSTWWRKVRIVPDSWRGYEVQIKYIWWPWWTQMNFSNTHATYKAAEEWARVFCTKETYI